MGSLGPGAHKVLFKPSEHLWREWGLILKVILPLLTSCWGFFLPLDMRYLYLVGPNFLLSIVFQQRAAILEFLQEKMSAHPSTPPSCLHHSLVSGQATGREHSPSHQQKIGLKIYWAQLHPSQQDPVSPSVSLFHQEASISLLSLSNRGQTDWKPQSQKANQTDCMDHSLV